MSISQSAPPFAARRGTGPDPEVVESVRLVEWILRDYENRSAGSHIAVLERSCIGLSCMDVIVPGSYWAAQNLLQALHASRTQPPLVARKKLVRALVFLRRLPTAS